MEILQAAPKVLDVGFNLLSAAVGLFVVAMALRLAPTFTLNAHQQSMRVLAVAAVIIVASEFIGIAAALGGTSTFTDAAEELAELIAILAAAAVLYFLGRAEWDEVSPLRRSANVDALTGLSSRGFFERAASRRVEQARDSGAPLACILLDVDDFKFYNDTYGHRVGDEMLRCVARTLRESARADDLVARYGGEEFVLLVNSEVEGAIEIAERIRLAVRRRCAPGPESPPERPATVSLGVAPHSAVTRSLEHLVALADVEMYRSKRAGKNRISVFDEV